MSALWDLVQTHLDATGLSERSVAREAGLTPQAISSWKHNSLRSLPHPSSLRAISGVIGVPYVNVLGAALLDAEYVEDDELPVGSLLNTSEVPDPKLRRALNTIAAALSEKSA